jgi:autotransporter-associated beta strand protein
MNHIRFATTRLLLFLALPVSVICAAPACAQDGFCMVNGTTTGGAGGTTVTVTTGTDFITQVGMTGARIVQVSGVLTIGDVTVRSDKTIAGLDTNATLLGRLAISGVSNVIVRNLRITNPGNDGISIRDPNTHHVWVDHVTFYDCGDGSCDISQGADYVTVSWCQFIYPTQLEHRFTMIADGQAGNTNSGRITLHHNWWGTRADQRMAASSYARVHYYNNYFNCTNNSYCSNARTNTEINSENNYYAGVKDAIGISSGTNGKIKTRGNAYVGCTGTIHPGTDAVFTPPYADTLDATVDVPSLVMAGAGAPGPDTMPVPPKIWDGGGSGNNLTTANNWRLNESPQVYDTLTFAGTTRLTPNNNFTAASEFPALNFSNNAGAFVLGGNAIGLGIGITNDSAATQTVNLNMDFTYGAHHYPVNRYFNVSSPSGNLVINGNLAGGTSNYVFSLIKQGDGTLVLNGTNTFTGSVQLNGGLLRFNTLDTNAAGSLAYETSLSFNGGGLQWATNNSADISVRTVAINSGGATLDVGTNNVIFTDRIGNGGAGALTKLGAGTLTFLATNNYRGDTLIAQGVLALGAGGLLTNSPQIILSNNATLDVSARSDGTQTLPAGRSLVGNGTVRGSVIAASGSTIAPGFSIGTLVITNVLTLQNGSTNLMELDAAARTNDLVTGMNSVHYGGTLLVTNLDGQFAFGNSFKLYDAANYDGGFAGVTLPPLPDPLFWTNRLAIDGTLAVGTTVNTAATNVNVLFLGTTLQVSWPADHTGCQLQCQTNSLSPTNWFTVPGSTLTNFLLVPVSPSNVSVFFRLVYP